MSALQRTDVARASERAELARLLEQIPVRDGLAVERTVLAAERTLLAYARTAFALFATGLAGAHFLTGTLATIGVLVAASGIVMFPIAARRYSRTRRTILELLRRLVRDGE